MHEVKHWYGDAMQDKDRTLVRVQCKTADGGEQRQLGEGGCNRQEESGRTARREPRWRPAVVSPITCIPIPVVQKCESVQCAAKLAAR